MFKAPHLVFGAGLVVLGTGCLSLLDVQAEVQEACLTYRDVNVAGTIPGDGMGSAHTTFTFTDLDSLKKLVEYDAKLTFIRAEVRAKSGVETLDFIDAAHVKVASGDPESTLTPLRLYDCDADCLVEGDKMQMPIQPEDQPSAVAYVKTNSLLIDLDLKGNLPIGNWKLEVDVCVSGHFAYRYEP